MEFKTSSSKTIFKFNNLIDSYIDNLSILEELESLDGKSVSSWTDINVTVDCVTKQIVDDCGGQEKKLSLLIAQFIECNLKKIPHFQFSQHDIKCTIKQTDFMSNVVKSLMSFEKNANVISSVQEYIMRMNLKKVSILALFQLHKLKILSFETHFERNSDYDDLVRKEIVYHVSTQGANVHVKGAISSYILMLIHAAHIQHTLTSSTNIQQRANAILKSIIHELINVDICEEENMINILDLVNSESSLCKEPYQKCCNAILIDILISGADLPLSDVIEKQDKWRTVTKHKPILSALFSSILHAVGLSSALSTLDVVVLKMEVNWFYLLAFVCTAVRHEATAAAKVRAMINSYISRGCLEFNQELLVLGFLFARQCCQEGRHIFPPYLQWLESVFGSRNNTPADNKRTFAFLQNFLTELVPHEPAHVLQSHLAVSWFVPHGCHPGLKEYQLLAKARLQQLNDDHQRLPQLLQVHNPQVEDQVAEASKYFEENKKLSPFIVEASIFRRPFYMSTFLPTLLKPRLLPDIPDTRMQLIAALQSAAKIPANIFNAYKQKCKKMADELTMGAFSDDLTFKNDFEQPLDKLEDMLQHFKMEVKSSSNCHYEQSNHIRDLLEDMFAIVDNKMKDCNHIIACKGVNKKLISVQVVQKILDLVESLIFDETPYYGLQPLQQHSHFTSIAQLISLTTSSATIQTAFSGVLLDLVESFQNLDERKMKLLGVVLSEVSRNEGLFLHVISTSSGATKKLNFASEVEPKSLPEVIFSVLPNKDFSQCYFTALVVGTWLEWDLLHYKTETHFELKHILLQFYFCMAAHLLVFSHGGLQNDESSYMKCMSGASIAPHTATLVAYECHNASRVPMPCKLFLQAQNTLDKPNMNYWVSFELNVCWEVVGVHHRLNFLLNFIRLNYLIANPNEEGKQSVILQLIQALINNKFSKKANASLFVVVLQRLAVEFTNTELSLLSHWKMIKEQCKQHHHKLIKHYFSLCLCFDVSCFLSRSQLLHMCKQFTEFVAGLLVSNESCFLEANEVLYLLQCVLSAAATNAQTHKFAIQQCITNIKPSIIFHWHNIKQSLDNLFVTNSKILDDHPWLKRFVYFLREESTDANVDTCDADDVAVHFLALTLRLEAKHVTPTNSSTSENIKHPLPIENLNVMCRLAFLKRMLAYTGVCQMQGLVPLLPRVTKLNIRLTKIERHGDCERDVVRGGKRKRSDDEIENISQERIYESSTDPFSECYSLLVPQCQGVLLSLYGTHSISIADVLPSLNDVAMSSNAILRASTVASAFLALLALSQQHKLSSSDSQVKAWLLALSLHSQSRINKFVEEFVPEYEISENYEDELIELKVFNDMSYVSELNKCILSHINCVGVATLNQLQSLITDCKCDKEVIASIKLRLANL